MLDYLECSSFLQQSELFYLDHYLECATLLLQQSELHNLGRVLAKRVLFLL